jgi:NTE family protein
MKQNKKSISLVLGSGGARGYAHIGVIEELEEQGYEIVSISGASMGALVGGLYACGKLQMYKEWVLGLSALDVASLLDLSWDKRGFVKGVKIFGKLAEMIGDIKIEALPIRYTAVATDLKRNKEVWFQEGSLLEAIRASISIPSFFTPVEKEGMLLVDGGVLNPLPVAPTMSDQSEMTIAVNLYGDTPLPQITVPERQLQRESSIQNTFGKIVNKAENWLRQEHKASYHLFDVVDMTFDSMQKTLIGYRLGGYPPDMMIEIPSTVCGTYDFHKAYMAIETGRLAAKVRLKE